MAKPSEQPASQPPPPAFLREIARLVDSPNSEDRRRGLLQLHRAPYHLDGIASFERVSRTAEEESGFLSSLSPADQTIFAEMSVIGGLLSRIASLRNDPHRAVRRLAINLTDLWNEHTRTGLSLLEIRVRSIRRRWLLWSTLGVVVVSVLGFSWLGWRSWPIPVGALAAAMYLRKVAPSSSVTKRAA